MKRFQGNANSYSSFNLHTMSLGHADPNLLTACHSLSKCELSIWRLTDDSQPIISSFVRNFNRDNACSIAGSLAWANDEGVRITWPGLFKAEYNSM